MNVRLELAIARAPAAREQQRRQPRRRDRIDDQLVAALPIDRAQVHRPHLVEPMVVADVPRAAARRLQIGGRVRDERRRCQRHTVGAEPRVDRVPELIERAGRGRRALEEQPEAAAQRRAARLREQHRRADARRHVELFGDAVAIQPAAELQIPARARLISILREERRVGAAHQLRRQRPIIEPARERSVGALDQHRPAHARSAVVRAQQIDADLEEMQATERAAAARRVLHELIRAGIAMLAVEEVAERRVRPQHHRLQTLRPHVGLKIVELNHRLREQRVGPERAFHHARAVCVRVDIDRRVGRRERSKRVER